MAIKEEKKEEATPLHGDMLDVIISRVPSLHLLPAASVSRSWRSAVSATLRLSPRHRIPWLVLHLQTRSSPCKPLVTFAFDPTSRSWISIPHNHQPPLGTNHVDADLLNFSHPGLLHALTFSILSYSTDAFAFTWRHIPAPSLWRTDAVVALVGSHLVVAGGTCDFEDDPCAVEVIQSGGKWELCESMPEEFQDRAAATWLCVAISGRTMYIADRNKGWFSSFDPVAGKWGKTHLLRPDPAVYVSVIGVSGDRIILVGATGEAVRVEAVVMWEVDPASMQCAEMGRMPAGMVERLAGGGGLWTIGFSNVGDCGYIYNPSEPKEVFLCEFGSGSCSWEVIGSPEMVVHQYPMLTLAFGCSAVGMADLAKIVAETNA